MAQGIVDEFMTLKEQADAELLAMQVGDFYEFFGEDAETVATELDLQLSEKSAGGESYPMAGVPIDELTPYLTALVERGYRVAVADQTQTEGGHTRELSRIVSPGTLLETTDHEPRYLATLVADETYGVTFADITTGQFFVQTIESGLETLLSELYRFDPVEIVLGPAARTDQSLRERLQAELSAPVTEYESDAFAPGQAAHRVREQFGTGVLESLSVPPESPAIRAAGGTLAYIATTGPGVLASFTRLQRVSDHADVHLDATTRRNLELTETMRGDSAGSLLATIDETVTSPGRRRLQEWLRQPIRDRERLKQRYAAIDALTERALARDRLQEELQAVYDLPRLASRAAHGSAGPHELLQVSDTLTVLPVVREIITADRVLADTPLAAIINEPDQPAVEQLHSTLQNALRDDPASGPADGGVIAPGYDPALDEILEEHGQLTTWFDELADRIKEQHGLTHVTVDRNKTDGYYIQVGKSEADQVPERFREIKTLKNSKRFVTDELQDRERALLELEEQRSQRETELFGTLREEVAEATELLQTIGQSLSTIDVLAGLAERAATQGWVRPELGEPGGPIEIDQGRHPVVETTTRFVPNDATLTDEHRVTIVTGPNMSGKSTYMRQVALIVLLAQIGSFVPADHARIGPVDGIYTRVGAIDELAQGRSTFMVEMEELSRILHAASEASLVILDEVGRGTATYDGISIAWATTEYIHNEIGAKTLFATHYHELTTLGEQLAHVRNVHVAADETDGDVTFLRTIEPGPTDRSYGIHVANLAGIPNPVVGRARTVLDRLRNEKAIEAKGTPDPANSTQVVFDLNSGQIRSQKEQGETDTTPTLTDRFGSDAETVLEALTELDVETATPIEVLATVQDWQQRLENNTE